MEERQICCCGASGWTKVIAWIQIVMYVLATVMCVLGLIVLIITGKQGFEEIREKNPQVLDYAFITLIIYMVATLLLAGVGITMGVVLLKGSQQRNVKYLKWWIIFAAVSMVWALISISGNGSIFGIIFEAVLTVLMYGFGMWVVRTHIQEIESDPRREPPPHYQASYAEKP